MRCTLCSCTFFFLMIRRPPRSTLFPTRRSSDLAEHLLQVPRDGDRQGVVARCGGHLNPQRQPGGVEPERDLRDRKSTRLNSSPANISYADFCLKKKKDRAQRRRPCDLLALSLRL